MLVERKRKDDIKTEARELTMKCWQERLAHKSMVYGEPLLQVIFWNVSKEDIEKCLSDTVLY